MNPSDAGYNSSRTGTSAPVGDPEYARRTRGSKGAYFAKENEYQRWRAVLLRYKNGIERNLAELRALHSQATQQPKTPGSMTAGERRQRGEAIDARLDRIESMLERLLAIAERGE